MTTSEIQEKEQKLYAEMDRLADLYESVKPVFLLAEYYNKENGIVESSINEIRAAFDHLMRSMRCEDDDRMNAEFRNTESHLIRAAFDAYELIALDRLEFIYHLKSGIPYDAIVHIYPDYTTKVLPLVSQLKHDLVEVRMIPNSKERLEEYSNKILDLIKCTEDLEKAMPEIVAYRKRQEMESLLSPAFMSIVFGAVLVMVTLFKYLWPDIDIAGQILTGLGTIVSCITYYLYKARKRGGE